MIFKYHAFEIVPWGAILDIDCTSSSKKAGRVTNWSTSTNYQTEYGYLGSGRSFFIESKAEPMSMTYSCTSKNGDLVDIQTNLTCTSTKVNGIITSFTIDNTNWFNTAYTTEPIQIQKVIKKVKITLNNTPYSINSDYLKFYVGDSLISYTNYENNTFYFNTQNTSPVINENTNIKSIYYITNETQEKNITTERYNNLYDKVYISKGCFEKPKEIYNISRQVDITDTYYNYNYDSTEKKYMYIIKRGTNLQTGDIVNITYRSYEKIQETINTIRYSSSYGKGFVNKRPMGSSGYTSAINTSRSNANVTIYTYGYDSNEGKYYFLFRVNSNYQIGDIINITYYYLNEVEETKKALEATDYTLHQGTITQHTNLAIEDCLGPNNEFILYNRDGNTISLSTSIYDGKNITVRYEKDKPYVKLCCNNVKIETILANSANNHSCDFEKLETDTEYIYPKAVTNYNSKSKFSRYAKISWNKNEYQRLYFGEEGTGGLYWGISGGSSNGYTLLAETFNHSTNNLWVTIPAINTLSKPYYYIACTVNIRSCSWYGNFNKYLNSNFTSYTEDGYIKPINNINQINISLDSHKTPEIKSLKKWGDNNSFYQAGNYYINPSDGIQLFTDWTCDGYVPCGQGCGEGCGESSKTKYAVVKSGGASGFSSWPGSGSGEYWVPGGTETSANNYNSSSGGAYYFTWWASWGDWVSAWVYSDNVDIIER